MIEKNLTTNELEQYHNCCEYEFVYGKINNCQNEEDFDLMYKKLELNYDKLFNSLKSFKAMYYKTHVFKRCYLKKINNQWNVIFEFCSNYDNEKHFCSESLNWFYI